MAGQLVPLTGVGLLILGPPLDQLSESAIDTTTQLRRSGRKEIRYPWRDKLFYPLLWPAQAMSLEVDRIVLPMGRGRKSICLPRPEWLNAPSSRSGDTRRSDPVGTMKTSAAGLVALNVEDTASRAHRGLA